MDEKIFSPPASTYQPPDEATITAITRLFVACADDQESIREIATWISDWPQDAKVALWRALPGHVRQVIRRTLAA